MTRPLEATLLIGRRGHEVELGGVGLSVALALGGGDHVVGPPGVHVTSLCGS